MQNNKAPIAVALTGASGAVYALRLIEVLLSLGERVDVLVSKAALLVLATEQKLSLSSNPAAAAEYLQQYFNTDAQQLRVFGREDWFSPWASGSGQGQALIVCPCSTGTLSAIATGASDNLIERAADVALKERRKLILVLRETPYSEVHLHNMLAVTRMGAVVLPASPGFYHQPKSIADLVDFIVARILNQLQLPHSLMPAWGNNTNKDPHEQ